MALAPSWLSTTARRLTDFLGVEIKKTEHQISVEIGSPGVNGKVARENTLLNLFFYEIERSATGPDGRHDEPGFVRLFCLLSAFGAEEKQNGHIVISAGEMELRVIGEVVRILHERPVLGPFDVEGEQVTLQAVPVHLTLDDLNHLWSGQGDVVYHPSVAYEFALAPVVPKQRRIPPGRIGAVGIEVRPDTRDPWSDFVGTIHTPEATLVELDAADPAWVPQLLFAAAQGEARHLLLSLADAAAGKLGLRVRALGGAELQLRCERWDRQKGWQDAETLAEFQTAESPSPGGTVTESREIDHPLDEPGQASLYLVRSYTWRDVPGEVRSDPLLVTYVGGDGT